MILSRELGKRIWGGSTNMENGGGGVSSDYIAGLLAGYATESWVDEHYISIDFFSRLFQAHGTENGSEIDVMPNDLETTITSVESMFGFWTNLYISALGSNGAAPAGISLGMLTDVTISGTPSAGQVLTFDAATQKWVNGNAQAGVTALANLTDVTLTSLQNGQTLLYDSTTSKWYNSALKTINGQSLLGSGDISVGGGASGNYLPLSGGTLTGPNGDLLILRSTNQYVSLVYGQSITWSVSGWNNGNMTWWNSSINDNAAVLYSSGNFYVRRKMNVGGGTPADGSFSMDFSVSAKGWYDTGWVASFGNNNGGVLVGFRSNTYGVIGTSNRTNMIIMPDGGNLGVGIAPSSKLHVNGDITAVTTTGIGVVVNSSLSYAAVGMVVSNITWSIASNTNGNFTFWNSLLNNNAVSFSSSGDISAKSLYTTAYVTALSDARKKDITGEAGVSVEQIAHAPAVQFLWKDKERRKDGQQVGTLAQYWQTVLPEVVMDKGGELSMQYGVAALVSAIVTARKVVDHERRITELEKENERLKKEVEQLRLN